MKTKMLFFMESDGYGGAEQNFIRVFSHFSKVFQTTISTNLNSNPNRIQNESTILSIPFKKFNLIAIPKFKLLSSAINTLILIIRTRPKYVFIGLNNASHSIIPMFVFRLFGIYQYHSFLLVSDNFHVGNFRKKIYKYISEKAEWIAISENNRRILEERAELNNIHVVPNGFAPISLNPKFSKEEYLNNLNIQGEKFLLFMPARISNQKDHETLLKAVYKLPDRIKKQIVVLFAGSYQDNDPHYVHLVNIIKDSQLNEVIYFIGHDSQNYYDLLSISDIILLITHFEGQPTAILEAMGLGQIIVASDISGISEILTHQKNGLLVEESNDNQLKDILENVITQKNDYEFLGVNAKEDSKNFTLENMLNLIHNIFNR